MMTLGDIADQYRLLLVDETVGVRRSWEEMFSYTFRHCPKGTPLNAFDLEALAERLLSSGMQERIVAGYVKRWRSVLSLATPAWKPKS